MSNSIMVIHPYRDKGLWVFDDETTGLVKEPFVAGADIVIDLMTQAIPNADKGFNLIFSATAFPGHELELKWLREDQGGNWYYSDKLGMEGWLCPALFKYFEEAPNKLFVQFKAI